MTSTLDRPDMKHSTADQPSARKFAPHSKPTRGLPRGSRPPLLRRLSIRTKFLITALIGALTSVAIAGFAFVGMSALEKDTDVLELAITESLVSIADLKDNLWESQVRLGMIFAGDAPQAQTQKQRELTEQFDDVDASFGTFVRAFSGMDSTALQAQLDTYRTVIFDEFLPAVNASDTAASEQIRTDILIPVGEQLIGSVATTSDTVNEWAATTAEEAKADVVSTRLATSMIAGAGIVIILVLSLLISRQIRNNIAALSTSIGALAQGDLTIEPQVKSHDELGQIADQLRVALAALQTTMQGVVTTALSSVDMSQLLSAASSQFAASSAETSAQAAVVAAAAEQVSGNVQTVAAGAEQMSASIREIAQNAQEATAVALTAATTADSTNATISRLSGSSQEIGDVIKTITSIAEQTNLLALNATIEAARAGEAGKGFAVVASEVKDLAAESARAAEDVSRRVQAIQNDTDSAIDAIAQISEIIHSINNYQLTIASAVEEQTATTNEMSRSAAEAATGSSEIAANINGVAAVVEESTGAVANMDATIAKLAEQAQSLSDDVHAFKF